MNEQKCHGCKKTFDIKEFTNDSDKSFKTCNICRTQRNDKRRKNICETCGIKGVYNLFGQINGIRCKTHRILGMIDITRKLCKEKNCKTRANFNFEGEIQAIYCSEHKQIGMIDIKHKRCQENDCKTRPNFNFEDKTQAIYCSEHKQIGMIDIKSKRCQENDCKTLPNFNFEGKTQAIYCSEHKQIGMIDIKHKRCQENNCKTQPAFNFEGEIQAIYCSEHKQIGMIDIKNKRCHQEGCKIHPVFNFEDKTQAIYCSDHKQIGMIDIKHKKCQQEGCKTRPNFNFEGETQAIYCSEHKQIGMIDIKNKRCKENDCKTQPYFNFEGETQAIYCSEHKQIGMIDIKNKKCDICSTYASYGYINQQLSKCARHKLNLMFKKTKIKCETENCQEISEYGINEPMHCIEHRKEKEICLIGTTCKLCERKNELCNDDGICLSYCRPTQLSQNTKVYIKKKESITLAYLDNNIKSHLIPIDDKIIDNSCVKRRPDRIYDCGFYFLIVEIDENQHNGYKNTGCVFTKDIQEKRRMIQIHEGLSTGQIPCVFLRFNPDNFKINGIIQKINMSKRLEILLKWVNYCLNLKIEDILNGNQILIKYLFYNDYDETDLEFENIKNIEECLN